MWQPAGRDRDVTESVIRYVESQFHDETAATRAVIVRVFLRLARLEVETVRKPVLSESHEGAQDGLEQ